MIRSQRGGNVDLRGNLGSSQRCVRGWEDVRCWEVLLEGAEEVEEGSQGGDHRAGGVGGEDGLGGGVRHHRRRGGDLWLPLVRPLQVGAFVFPFQDCSDLLKPNPHVKLIMCSIEECATPIPSIFEECPSPPSCNLGQAPQKKQDKEDKESSPSPPSYILRRQYREEEKQDEGSPSISTSSPVKTKSPVDVQSSFGVFDVGEDTGPGEFKSTIWI